MQSLPQKPELVEKIVLETRIGVWIALSVGGCGILTRANVGRHDEEYRESRSIALAFAHRVVHTIGLSRPQSRIPTPQILIDAADVEDVRVARIPLLPTTTIAIIEDRRLAAAIVDRAVPGNELFSFIESWNPPGTRIRTSVLLSL